ncbi:hypothetical protein [Sphingomonas sp. NIBR02145]|uniref:hypothetical protein n=1 Tax=Sphingomonas sp. NIBR02145 TaxID=3014784 RepID=UPI0022B490F3|nr:hypothetical protein [Sphingomonas sp. NIBR02145]WHU03847.1 hypothetical protein O3305_04440 [Sphingomonas sp. NIBR02145]
MTDVSVTSPVERIARVIAAEMLSPNGEAFEEPVEPVGLMVERIWPVEVERAMAILRTLREPTREMVAAGREAGDDPALIWNAMVRAALEQAVQTVETVAEPA